MRDSGDGFSMRQKKRPRAGGAGFVVALGGLALSLSACGTPEPEAALKSASSREYFSEAEYGVNASPRVSIGTAETDSRKGRRKIGKPYKVKGKWYRPRLDPEYSRVGAASWYGNAFHGRLTANGEVYDMTHLTAAHPTMPLPSYARVTNLSNGSSVIVRVNDRGPYADGRIIDLSKRAAELLDYTHAGVARVEVDYVGPAPLDGHDEQYLMASYRPGDGNAAPSDGLPDGVMMAMNGPTPTDSADAASAALARGFGEASVLPAHGPIVPDRPDPDIVQARMDGLTPSSIVLAYAAERVDAAAAPFDALFDSAMTPEDILQSWRGRKSAAARTAATGSFIVAGTWLSRDEAEVFARRLSRFGRIELEAIPGEDNTVYQLNLYPDGGRNIDATLQAAWAAEAREAFVVHD